MNFDQTDDSFVGLVNFPGIFTSRFIFRRQTLLMFYLVDLIALKRNGPLHCDDYVKWN